jgi:hypothetical protein
MTARQHATFLRAPLPPADRNLIRKLAAWLQEPDPESKDRAPIVADPEQAFRQATIALSILRAAGWTPPPRGGARP